MSAPDLIAAARAGDPVALTRALVATPSVNPSLSPAGTGEAAAAALCAGWLSEWGFRVEVLEAEPGRASVLARLGDGSPRTLLCGHLDTVGTEGMTVAPFDPVVKDGWILGRGSCDMKAGVAAILAAARELAVGAAQQGRAGAHAFPGELIVALTADEEHASIGLRHLLDRGLEADRAIVTEPTGLAIHPANKGFCWVEVEVVGRAAHGSRPDLGRDAIRGAARLLALLDEYEAELDGAPPHPLLGRGSIHAGTIRGGTTPSVYPARCDLLLEARTLPGEGPREVMARMERVAAAAREAEPDLAMELREGLHRPGAEISGDAPLVAGLRRTLREVTGAEPRIEGMSAWVESAWLVEAGIPAVCFGPGSISRAHTADEQVSIEEIRVATRVLTRLVGEGGGT